MSDLIERQAALGRAVEIPLFGKLVKIVAVRELEELPSVQPERKWIPCSEALPEYGAPVLWSNEHGSVFVSAITAMTDHSWAIGKRHRQSKVIAWQPLPEPYKTERREDG